MKIAVLNDGHEIIIVALDKDNEPVDCDGTLFGPESGRDIDDFEREEINTNNGTVISIKPSLDLRVM